MHALNKLLTSVIDSIWVRSVSLLFIPLLVTMGMFVGCTNTEDFANPLDTANLRTSGAPEGLKLYPGDQQVRVTWVDRGLEGIQAYKIYRRSNANSDDPFELVGTIDAPANEYIDTQNIENDRKDASGVVLSYEYRISYVDINGVETPDPTNPPSLTEEPFRIWQTATTTPSLLPPAPVVNLGEPSDLTVKLIWEGYEFPNDFTEFRVYRASDKGEDATPVFHLVAEIQREQQYYFDVNFRQDNVKMIYHVAAVDEFGAEAITTIRAASPNLPPAPPKNFGAQYFRRSLFNTKYDVVLTWEKNTEPDLDGYQIYTKDTEDNLLPRQKARATETSMTISGEDPIVIDQQLFFRSYFITAFDDTRAADGTLDESDMVEAQ